MALTKKRVKQIILDEAKRIKRAKRRGRLDEYSVAGGMVSHQPVGITSTNAPGFSKRGSEAPMPGVAGAGAMRTGQVYQDDRHMAFEPPEQSGEDPNQRAHRRVQRMLSTMDEVAEMFLENDQHDIAEQIKDAADSIERSVYTGEE